MVTKKYILIQQIMEIQLVPQLSRMPKHMKMARCTGAIDNDTNDGLIFSSVHGDLVMSPLICMMSYMAGVLVLVDFLLFPSTVSNEITGK
jgi:hypothetical protein